MGGYMETKPFWTTKLSNSLLPMYLLALIKQRPRYGYELISELSRILEGKQNISSHHVYPILTGFEKRRLIQGSWLTSKKPRKYFQITPRGEVALTQLLLLIQKTKENISSILRE